jgi:hypothetical protein
MTNVDDLFSEKDNRPESRYGSTRSTLFGKFYERIIANWLEKEKDYELKRRPNRAVHKPRIYWNKISLDNFNFAEESTFETKAEKFLHGHRSHCTPDGLFERRGKSYIWEAKNWPLYPEKGPESQIWNYFSNNPWILARTFDYEGNELEISGFLFSFWDMEIPVKKRIENKVNKIIGENKFEIILTKEIMKACIHNKYDWYVQIIDQEKNNIDKFFDQLLGITG